jgi:hypothetical protein
MQIRVIIEKFALTDPTLTVDVTPCEPSNTVGG